MSVRLKSSTADSQLEEIFGAPVAELYATATGPDASPALARALELRSFLALAEGWVARVRDRVHKVMPPDRDIGELSAEGLRLDAQWLTTALDAQDRYRAALGELLRTMPPPDQQLHPVRATRPVAAATLPPYQAALAPTRCGGPAPTVKAPACSRSRPLR